MKKKRLGCIELKIPCRKMVLIMKLSFFLFFCFLFQVQATVNAQLQTVSLHLNGASVLEGIRQLKKQTALDFFFSNDFVDVDRKMSLQLKNVYLEDALDQLLGGGYDYIFTDSRVIIKRAAESRPVPEELVLTGVVKDMKGTPLPAVTVTLKGTALGVATNMDGKWTLRIPAQKEVALLFSFVGMKTKEVTWRGEKEMKVVLEEEVMEMDEVVVTGIFNKPRESYTGAVTTITNKELKIFKGANMLQTLRNIDPAFNIVQNNAIGSDPNKLPEINLRGTSSLPKSVNELNQGIQAQLNAPLIIMDGFEISLQKLMDFNDEDIESVNILKDASATAIYGSRGANGVIVITTVAPKAGDLKIRVNGGINLEVPDLTSYDLLNAREKLDFENKMGYYTSKNNAEHVRLQKMYNELLLDVQNGVDTYWLSKPLRVGIGQKYNLNLDGGSREFRWAVSLGYSQTSGVMKGSQRDNFDGSVTLSYTLKDVLFRNQTRYSNNVAQDSKYGSFSSYVQMNPYWRPYDENGKPIKDYRTPNNRIFPNPLYNASLNMHNKNKTAQIIDNFSLEWNHRSGFRLKGRLGLTKTFKEDNDYKPAKHTNFDSYEGEDYFRRGTYSLSTGQSWAWDGNITLSYSKVLREKHQLYFGADASAGETSNYSYSIVAEGFNNENYDFFGKGAAYKDKPGGSESTTRRVGFTGTFNYTYDNRYFVDGSVRMDGASTFGGTNKFAPFWSVGAGWNLHKEKFIRNTGLFSTLRLRASFGQTGSQQFAPYESLTSYDFYLDDRYMLWNGAKLKGHANEDLKWQTTNQFNAGVEIGLWGNRLSFQVDVYNKKTIDLLSTINVPTSTGFGTYTANIGEVRNRGFEGKISGYLIRDTERQIMWSMTGNITHNVNEILELSDAIKKQTASAMQQDKDLALLYEGESMTSIYAVPSLGVDPATGSEIFLDREGRPTYTWHANSRRLAGNSEPKYRGNISTMFTYKNLTMNLSFGYQWGGQQYNSTLKDRVEISYDEGYANVDKRVYEERWMKPGDHSFYPKFSYEDTKSSSRFVQDDNVFSLQSVSLDYRNTGKWLRKMKVESFNVAVNASDLFYVSTIRRERGTSYPFARHATITFGFQF